MISKKTIKRIYNVVIILLLLCGIGYVCSRFIHLGADIACVETGKRQPESVSRFSI